MDTILEHRGDKKCAQTVPICDWNMVHILSTKLDNFVPRLCKFVSMAMWAQNMCPKCAHIKYVLKMTSLNKLKSRERNLEDCEQIMV